MTTPLDLVAYNRKWLRLHEHNKYQAEAARRITALLAEVERLRGALAEQMERADHEDRRAVQNHKNVAFWQAQYERVSATVDRVRELVGEWETTPGAFMQHGSVLASAWADAAEQLRAAIEGTDS